MNNPYNKIVASALEAIKKIPNSATIMSGGFGLSGNPENCIKALRELGTHSLTIISNNCGNQGKGLATLLKAGQVKKTICSFIGGNPDLEAQLLRKEIEVELNPQGTLAERIRAGGSGIGAFYTPTGVGTSIAVGKEEREIDGKKMLLETALKADFAIIRALKADPFGNLQFYGTSINFSPLMAMAARFTIVEAEELVPLGAIAPENIHLPGIFVQEIFLGDNFDNPIEHLCTRT